MDISVIFNQGLLWIMLLSKFLSFGNTHTHTHTFVNTYLEMEFLGHRIRHIFKFSRYHQTVFQTSCANIPSHQLCMRVVVAPYPQEYLVLSVFLIYSRLTLLWYWCRAWEPLILVCICIWTNDDLLVSLGV